MIVYFTGTGNSRHCAETLASELHDELLDAAGYIKHGIAADLVTGKPWVFVCPIYAWQMPRAFEAFIRSGSFAGSGDAYFVLTCGGDIGGAAVRAEALCKEVGLTYKGALEVVMPDNYIVLFKAPEEEEARRIIAAARPVLARGAACIREGKPFPEKRAGALSRLKSGAVNEGFYRFYVKAKGFHCTGACTGCGGCAELCPLGNIAMQDGRPVWAGRCTHCMACISGCPETAIEYGTRTRGKRRYRCPVFQKPDSYSKPT